MEQVTHPDRLVVLQSLSHVQLCNPVDRSTLGFPVLHHLLELAQTHVHRVGDTIRPSHPLSSPSPLAFSLSSIRVFFNESVLVDCYKHTLSHIIFLQTTDSHRDTELLHSVKTIGKSRPSTGSDLCQ